MTLPIAIQLYSLRDQLTSDFEATLEAVAGMGYVSVETAGYYGRSAAEVGERLRGLGLSVIGMHTDIMTPEGRRKSEEDAAALGCTRVVCAWQPPATFETREGVQVLAERLNEAAAELPGLTVLYHNHDAELRPLEGRPALYTLLEHLDPAVQLELDVYWTVVAGVDPVTLLRDLGSRVGLLHVKDGHVNPTHPMTAVGEGTIDYTPIVAAVPPSVPCLIVEMDEVATDPIDAVRKSAAYLVAKGWGHAR